jgi:hypothetical protein
MTVESVKFISDLDKLKPDGGDSISEGDDHIRNIKKAILETFPEIKGEVTASHEDINRISGFVQTGNGVFASCKWDGSVLAYGHNVSSVDWSGGKRNTIYFSKPTDGFDNHYAVQFTPIASNARPVIAFVTDQRDSWISVDIWEFDGSNWGTPVGPVGFYMTMVDMIQTEANANT